MSLYQVPSITVALELDIFEALLEKPASPAALAKRMNYSERGLIALLTMLMSMGFLCRVEENYQLTEVARGYMIKSSPFYWGGLFKRVSGTIVPHRLLLESVANKRKDSITVRPADGWESGHVDMELAKEVTAFMHSHSMPAAVGMTQSCDFSAVRKLLDVGGGSGCFSIALAQGFPDISCTVMELATIAELADEYIAAAGVKSQVDTVVVDMFRQQWPSDYDAIFFSNIFHDWSFETCAEIAQYAFNALPSGGKIYLHEMLLDDGGTEPHHAVAFSVLMAMGTLGQQFTLPQLEDLLANAGFADINCRHSYAYYSLISAKKP